MSHREGVAEYLAENQPELKLRALEKLACGSFSSEFTGAAAIPGHASLESA